MKILFMCVENSARSQMAEGLARKLFGQKAEIESAGSKPSKLNPLAMKALREVGIDITDRHSKSVGHLSPRFLVGLDYVITLCAEEICPVTITQAKKLHWAFPNPTDGGGSLTDEFQRFRDVRDGIQLKLHEFIRELQAK